MNTGKLRVAVIGVGSMGKNHARNFHILENAELIAVCDSDTDRGRKIADEYNTQFYSNHSELLSSENLDCVVVAVPTLQHFAVVSDFLKNKISVLVEKPISDTVENARALIELAKENNVLLAVGHIERFNPAVRKLKELVERNELGDILSIVVRRVGLYPPRIKDVNVITDLAVHDLDIVSSILKRMPISIFARGGSGIIKTREDHSGIFLDYGDFGCFIQVNWVTPVKIRQLSITGTKGHVDLNYVTQSLEVYKIQHEFEESGNFEEFISKYGGSEKEAIEVKNEEPLKLQLEHFLNAVSGKEDLEVTGKDGLQALVLAEATLKSLREKIHVIL